MNASKIYLLGVTSYAAAHIFEYDCRLYIYISILTRPHQISIKQMKKNEKKNCAMKKSREVDNKLITHILTKSERRPYWFMAYE